MYKSDNRTKHSLPLSAYGSHVDITAMFFKEVTKHNSGVT